MTIRRLLFGIGLLFGLVSIYAFINVFTGGNETCREYLEAREEQSSAKTDNRFGNPYGVDESLLDQPFEEIRSFGIKDNLATADAATINYCLENPSKSHREAVQSVFNENL